MKLMKFIGCLYLLVLFFVCGSRILDYDVMGIFEVMEVLVLVEVLGKFLYFYVEEGIWLKVGEEVGLIDML